ncbi:MAG: hypothetical protein ACSLEZ_05760 [Thiobacillus sp.]
MLPPLLRVLLAQPTLLTGYASAYAALLRQDAAGWQARQLYKLGYLLRPRARVCSPCCSRALR